MDFVRCQRIVPRRREINVADVDVSGIPDVLFEVEFADHHLPERPLCACTRANIHSTRVRTIWIEEQLILRIIFATSLPI